MAGGQGDTPKQENAPARLWRRLQREQEPKSPFVFTSEREAPFSTAGFARMVERAGTLAKLSFKAHPHMLSTPAATRWPTRATTRGRCKLTLDTGTFSTRCGTLRCHRRGSKTSGETTGSHPAAPNSQSYFHSITLDNRSDKLQDFATLRLRGWNVQPSD
jgi:hypothetical protein